MTPTPLKKMTVKEIMEIGRGGALEIPKEHTQLAVIYGVVTASIAKPTQFNKNEVLLMGRFKAVRAKDRQEFTAERLYLPDSDYQKQLAQANCPDRDSGEVFEINFAYNVGYKPLPGSPTGYAFTCSPVIDYKVQDALADVEKQINFDKVLPALAAPSAEKPADGGKKK